MNWDGPVAKDEFLRLKSVTFEKFKAGRKTVQPFQNFRFPRRWVEMKFVFRFEFSVKTLATKIFFLCRKNALQGLPDLRCSFTFQNNKKIDPRRLE